VALSTYAPGYVYNENVFITSTGTNETGMPYPSGSLWNTQANVEFTNFGAANYQLLTGSHYHNAGTDGKDIGGVGLDLPEQRFSGRSSWKIRSQPWMFNEWESAATTTYQFERGGPVGNSP